MKQVRLNVFRNGAPGQSWPSLWRHPRDKSSTYTDMEFWVKLAQLAEQGKFDAIFLGDVNGVYDVYKGTPQHALEGAVQLPINDPFVMVPIMASVTKNLGFAVTSNLSFEAPYLVARRFSSLDHITKGRIGWNIVTGFMDSAARAMGVEAAREHDTRYEIGDEYMEVVYKLWEGSWQDDAVVRDRENNVYARSERVHNIGHRGKYFNVDAIHLCEPSPQRTPVLYQAGASSRGRAFAAKHAECIFLTGHDKKRVAATVKDIRQRAKDAGRDPNDVLIFLGATVIVAATDSEAKARYEEYRQYVDPIGVLTLLAGWTGIDFGKYSPDEPIRHVNNNAIRSMVDEMTRYSPDRAWTVRDLGEFAAVGARESFIVGSPQTVADELLAWVNEADIDGFNLYRVVEHESLQAYVDLLVPELQNRGAYKTEYAPGTYREKLFGSGRARLLGSHPAAAHRKRAVGMWAAI